MLFEVSWEVCNKVGGINTVLKSKASQMVDYYSDGYYLVGPYFAKMASGELEETLPQGNWIKVASELKKQGIICHFGKWLVGGEPNVILLDFANSYSNLNEIKKNLWDWYKIDSLNVGHDYDEPITWNYAVFLLLQKVQEIFKGKNLGQFHEWLSGVALLYLKQNKIPIPTVFTTHATVLGRTLSSHNVDLYCKTKNKYALEVMDLEKEAYNYGVAAKHQVEKNSAQKSDVFTTVSEITGLEAKFILGRKPDVLLLNGLDINRFPTFEEISVKHGLQRDRIREFLLYYFLPYYDLDLDNTLIYFIAGRYEFHDKGIDVFVESLGALNALMKENKSDKTVVAFIWVPAGIRGINTDLLENRTFYHDVRDSVDEHLPKFRRSLLSTLISQKKITGQSLFDEGLLMEMKRKVLKLKKKGVPALSTHQLENPNDIILQTLKKVGLENKKQDKVKVIFYPIYLNGADGLLDLNYYECMQGAHLGVFPSFYEPWGYTPLEASALGVASVTTDLAGFGRYVKKKTKGASPGIFVLDSMGISHENIVNQLTKIMYSYSKLTKHGRIKDKIAARKLAETADWNLLAKNYKKAHDLANGN